MQVRQSLLVLLGDGQQSAQTPDLVVDVVPSSFGSSFGGSVTDHVHEGRGGEKTGENKAWELKVKKLKASLSKLKEKKRIGF